MNKKALKPFRPTPDLRQSIAKELKSYAVYHEVNFVPTEVVRNIVRRLADKADMGMPTNRQIGPALAYMDKTDMFYHYQSVPGSTGLATGITPYYSMTWGKVMAEKARKAKRDRSEAIDNLGTTIKGLPSVNKDGEVEMNKVDSPKGDTILLALQKRRIAIIDQLNEIDGLIDGIADVKRYLKDNPIVE